METNQPFTETLSQQLCSFLNEAPTPFHAARKMATLLLENDFVELAETATWTLEPGGKYFVCGAINRQS